MNSNVFGGAGHVIDRKECELVVLPLDLIARIISFVCLLSSEQNK
jgi:hypothetical protein